MRSGDVDSRVCALKLVDVVHVHFINTQHTYFGSRTSWCVVRAFKIREYIIDTNEMDRVHDAGPIRLLGISDTQARDVDKTEGSCHGQDGFMEIFE